MKLRLLVTILFIVGLNNHIHAQLRQADTTYVKSIIPEEKQGLLKNVDMIANMQLGARADFYDGEFEQLNYKFEQFRLEIKGYVHEKVFFRFRHRYTSTFEPQSVDKIVKGVDFAYLRFDLNDKLQLTIGKTFADWGGYEFDLNPIDIYEYSDIIEQADNFLTGAGIYYQATKKHGFSFQILNSRTAEFEEIYPNIPNIEPSKAPLAGVVNWRGSLFNGKFTTIWSYSLFNEAKDKYKNYVALGNKLTLDKISISYDYKWSKEDLDRTGIISGYLPTGSTLVALENTLYTSHWISIDYKFADKWHIAFTGFYDKAKWLDDIDPRKTTDEFRDGIGYIPTIEYYPWNDLNLKFFLGYVGRNYKFSDYAKNDIGLKDYSTGRIMFGIISPLNIL